MRFETKYKDFIRGVTTLRNQKSISDDDYKALVAYVFSAFVSEKIDEDFNRYFDVRGKHNPYFCELNR